MTALLWFSLLEVILLGLTLLATVLVGGFVAWQTHRHFALQRSQEFIQRLNSPEFAAVRRRAERWVCGGELPCALLDRVAIEEAEGREGEATQIRSDLRLLTNFYQELGTAMRHQTLDRRYAWGVFGGLIKRHWLDLRAYVFYARYDSERETLLEDFEWLAAQMRREDLRRARHRRRGEIEDTAMKEPLFLFGYGSLFDPASAAKTAGRSYERSELWPAWLEGYARSWDVFDHVRFEDDDEATPTVFLNLRAEPEAKCNGVLIPVEPGMWDAFDRRERSYRRVEVTERITPCPPGRVFTYVGVSPWVPPPGDAVVPASYEAMVAEAVAAWGEKVSADYAATTEGQGWPTREGAYTFEAR
ncbi:MAG: gamma-glutamylcyclotransferase family protein [Planctomycetota bacterium]